MPYSSRAEGALHHLRRELEEGNISWNDYERTTHYLSTTGNPRLFGAASSLSASACNVYYGRWYRKPPWPWSITAASTPLAFMVGLAIPAVFRAARTWRLYNELEDPKGLNEALARAFRESIAHSSEPEDGADNSIGGQSDGKQDRWAELRKASAPAPDSRWDKIRQSHERSGVPSMTRTGPKDQTADEKSGGSGFDDRQTEQAKFDALLEAERRMSS